MNKNKRQREWEDALNLMTEDELQFIREHPVGYYQNFVKMATEKAWEMIDDPYPIPEKQAMTNAIINILEELGSQCGINDDNEICFICHGANYTIRIDKDYDYTVLHQFKNKYISVNTNNCTKQIVEFIVRLMRNEQVESITKDSLNNFESLIERYPNKTMTEILSLSRIKS